MKIWKNIQKYASKPEIIVTFLAAVILFVLFFVLKLGVADNGDFGRIMLPTGLKKIGNSYFEYIEGKAEILKFKLLPARDSVSIAEIVIGGSYISSHLLPIFIARFLSLLIYNDGFFHFEVLTVIYSVLFLIGIYFLTLTLTSSASLLKKILVSAIVLFMLCDATKLVYFNSLYGEAWAYVTFILAFVFLVNGNKKCFYFFIALFFSAKSQYLPLSISLIFFVNKNWKKNIVIFSIILLCFTAYFLTPKGISRDTLFISVFNGVLKNSPNIQADMQELGVPEEYESWAGRSVYDFYDVLKTDEFVSVKNMLSRGKVIKFYMHHPIRFTEKLSNQQPFSNRVGLLANYSEDTGKIGEKNSFWTGYDWLTSHVFPKNFWVVIPIYLLIFVVGCVKKDRKLMFLTFLALPQYFLPIIGNGETDSAKQLFMFNVTTDFILIYLLTKINTQKTLMKR